MPCDSTENGETPFWLSVVAFGKQAEALARHVKGELISVSGTMQINQWTTKDGSTSSGYQMDQTPPYDEPF
nr:single-stranded DNA-binding protein [Serratia symbiotica]